MNLKEIYKELGLKSVWKFKFNNDTWQHMLENNKLMQEYTYFHYSKFLPAWGALLYKILNPLVKLGDTAGRRQNRIVTDYLAEPKRNPIKENDKIVNLGIRNFWQG